MNADKLKIIGACAIFTIFTGCSTAGPYVTNISSDGGGGLTVEKCMAHLNAFMGVINNSDCTTTNIHLSNSTPPTK